MSDDAVPDSEGVTPATPRLVDAAEPMELGGDPACWLGRVCDNCGALIEGSRGVPCWRCKTPWEPV